MSEGQGGGAELRDNQPDPNLNESHAHSQTPGPRELISLNNNAEEEEETGEEGYSGIKGEEDEENDEMMMKEEDTSDESSLISRQSLDTSTNDSYSENGSLLETPYPISPGTSPEPMSVASLETPDPISSGNTPEPPSQDMPTASLEHTNPISAGISPEPTCPVTPVVTLGPAYPISPVAQNPCELEVDTPTCITRPIDSTLTITTTGSTCVTGPITSSLTTPSAAGSACMSGPACIGTINSTVNFSTDVPCGSGSSCTSAMGSGSSETADCTTGPSAPISRQDTTSTSGPISITDPTATTGTTPSSALLASLQRLGQIGDDIHLPQYLHQLAEAFALQEDYQSASCCIHLERLYHQRIIDNINTLQGHWESRCRTLVSDQCSQQLNVLTHICQTHERPSAGHILCASLDFRNLSTAEQDRLCGLSSTWIPARGETEPAETHTDSSEESSRAVGSFTEEDTNRNTEEHGNQLTRVLESQRVGAAAGGHATTTSVEDHTARGEMDPSTREEEEPQSGERGTTEVEGERLVEEAVEVDYEEKQKAGLDSSPADLGSAPTQQTAVSENVLPVDDHHGQTQCDEEDCGGEEEEEEVEEDNVVENMNLIRESSSLDDMAKLITIEQMSPDSGLISILKKRIVCVEDVCVSTQSHPTPAKRRVHFNVPDDCFEHDVGGGDSCLLLFLLCFVTVVISVGGTALYCALGDTHSSVCQDFSRNTDFYFSQLQHWFTTGSGSV